MKNLITILALLIGFCASASIESVEVASGYTPSVGSKLVHVDVLSSDNETVAVKSLSEIYASSNVVTSTATTNTTYVLVYSNGVNQVITNITSYSQLPLPRSVVTISYATNVAVSVTSVTNAVTYLSQVVTNTLASVSPESSRGYADPTNVYLVAGDRVIYEAASGKPRVTLFLEK